MWYRDVDDTKSFSYIRHMGHSATAQANNPLAVRLFILQ